MRDFFSNKYRLVFRLPVIIMAAIFLFAGCSPKVDVALAADNRIQLSFSSGTGKTVAGLYFSDTSELKYSLQNLGFSVAKLNQPVPTYHFLLLRQKMTFLLRLRRLLRMALREQRLPAKPVQLQNPEKTAFHLLLLPN